MPLVVHNSPASQCCAPGNTAASDLHLLFAPQTEAIQTLVATDVAEHRLNHGYAMTVNRFALLAIDSVFHPVDIRWAKPEFQGVGDLSSFALAVI